jgi:hypothetical protein
MQVEAWAVIATLLGVVVYVALPVALAVVYLSRVRAALAPGAGGEQAASKDNDGTER